MRTILAVGVDQVKMARSVQKDSMEDTGISFLPQSVCRQQELRLEVMGKMETTALLGKAAAAAAVPMFIRIQSKTGVGGPQELAVAEVDVEAEEEEGGV